MPWILAAVIVTGLAVFSLTQKDDQPATVQQANRNTTITNTNQPIMNINASVDRTAAHPVSIPALIDYQPTGRDLKLGRVLSTTATYTRYYITYRSDDLIISGIMNIPKGAGPFPVLFLNHGYIDTSIYTNGRGLKREQDYFANRGFAVLHSDYRCHADSSCPTSDIITQRLGYIKDVINAVTAVQQSTDSRLSKTAFGMLGHSMGGGITQRLIVSKPDLIDAAVLYAPVSTDERDSFRRYTSRRPAEAQKVIETYGTLESNPEFWDNLSARKYLERITVPMTYFQGTRDADVPKEWADTTVELLKAAGKDVTYVVYDGQPHEFTPPTWNRFMDASAKFFRDHLK